MNLINIDQLKDILERAVFTYIQTFLGLISASGMGVDMGGISTWKIAALGGLPAAFSVIKGALAAAAPIGDSSASILKGSAVGVEEEEALYE